MVVWATNLCLRTRKFCILSNKCQSCTVLILYCTFTTSLYHTYRWYQNLLLGSTVNEQNKVFQIPYIIDTAGPISGMRAHHGHVESLDRMVIETYEPDNGITLGGVESFGHHTVRAPSKKVPRLTKLAIELEWKHSVWTWFGTTKPKMRAAIVRGSPYARYRYTPLPYYPLSPIPYIVHLSHTIPHTSPFPYVSMEYIESTPRIFVQRALRGDVIVDNKKHNVLECGEGYGTFSGKGIGWCGVVK